jgi:hypothetical protein
MGGWYLWLFVTLFIPAMLVVAGIAYATRRMAPIPRIGVFVASATLVLTPSWGPATIVMVPVPFGLHVVLALAHGELRDLASLIADYSIWHAIAFPATATLSYVLARLALPRLAL